MHHGGSLWVKLIAPKVKPDAIDGSAEISEIGMLNDGQKVVRFRYKGDAPMRIGLLAQDVMEHEPDAVKDFGGVLGVDHRKATERAAAMGRAA